MEKRNKIVKNSIIGIFVTLYAFVSIISTIHVVDFFQLTNPDWLAYTLAIAFELGAAASLAAIIILDKTNRTLVWALFIVLTLMQSMGNMYYAFDHAADYQSWVELFALERRPEIFQKRVLAFISGGILPLVALGFIKSLVDYIRPKSETPQIEAKDEEDNDLIDDIEDDQLDQISNDIVNDELDLIEEVEEEYHEGVEDFHLTPTEETYEEPDLNDVDESIEEVAEETFEEEINTQSDDVEEDEIVVENDSLLDEAAELIDQEDDDFSAAHSNNVNG